MNADGSGQTRLTDNPGEDVYTNWSPDSQRIVFATTRAGTQSRDIWIMDADGENETPLISTPASDSDPAFSPDGQFVAFTSGGHIYFASFFSDGSNLVQVTTAADVDDRSPNWQSLSSGAPAGLCPTVTPKVCGDANSDGDIKATDALVVEKSVASPVVCPKIRCDTDTSGTVLASDHRACCASPSVRKSSSPVRTSRRNFSLSQGPCEQAVAGQPRHARANRIVRARGYPDLDSRP